MIEDINYNFYLRLSIEIILDLNLIAALNARHMNSYGSWKQGFLSATGLIGLGFGIAIPSFCALLIGTDIKNNDHRISSLKDEID